MIKKRKIEKKMLKLEYNISNKKNHNWENIWKVIIYISIIENYVPSIYYLGL